MDVVATVIILLLNFFSLTLGATANIYLLQRAFIARYFTRKFLLEINIVATGALVCAGIIPISLLRRILNFFPNFDSDKICFIENFCRTLSYNSMLMTLIFFSFHRIQRVKTLSRVLQLSTVQVVEVGCVWIVGGLSACVGFFTFMHKKGDRGRVLSNNCVPLHNSTALTFQNIFVVCLFSVSLIAMLLSWFFIIKYIHNPFRIEPNDACNADIEHNVIDAISGTCENDIFEAEEGISHSRTDISSNENQMVFNIDNTMRDIPSRYGPSVNTCSSCDHGKMDNDHRDFADILSTQSTVYTKSLQQRRSTFCRSHSDMNLSETRKDTRVINKRSFQRRSKSSIHLFIQGKVSDASSVNTYKSVLSRHSSSLKSNLDFCKSGSIRVSHSNTLSETEDVFEKSHDKSLSLQSDVCKTEIKTHFDAKTFHQRDQSINDSQGTHRESVFETTESYASSISSSHIEFHILEKRTLQVTPDNSLSNGNAKTKASFGSCSTIGDIDGLSMEREFFSESQQSQKSNFFYTENPDHRFSPSEKVRYWKQNYFCAEDETSNDAASFYPNLSNISKTSQSMRLNESRTSSRIPVQIKITRPSTAENQLKVRRNALVQALPLLQINKTSEGSDDSKQFTNKCTCIPIRQQPSPVISRTKTAITVSKRFCLSIAVCCLIVPHLVINILHIRQPEETTAYGIPISNAVADLVFAVNPYLYLLCNKSLMKMLYSRPNTANA